MLIVMMVRTVAAVARMVVMLALTAYVYSSTHAISCLPCIWHNDFTRQISVCCTIRSQADLVMLVWQNTSDVAQAQPHFPD